MAENKPDYASNILTTGYGTKNDAIAGAIAGAAAIQEQNPDVKITIAVGLKTAIQQMREVPLEDKSRK